MLSPISSWTAKQQSVLDSSVHPRQLHSAFLTGSFLYLPFAKHPYNLHILPEKLLYTFLGCNTRQWSHSHPSLKRASFPSSLLLMQRQVLSTKAGSWEAKAGLSCTPRYSDRSTHRAAVPARPCEPKAQGCQC